MSPGANVGRATSIGYDRPGQEAAVNLERFGGVLTQLFPALTASGGIIESPLYVADALRRAISDDGCDRDRWLIKADHALPTAGSIKARGGFYEVLLHAQHLALRAGLQVRARRSS